MSAGSIVRVSVAGRSFSVAADSDVNYELGGWNVEHQPNGDGTARPVKTRVLPMVGPVSLGIDPNKADLEFLQEKANAGEMVAFQFEMANGVVYQGKMGIEGSIQAATMSSTAPITFKGEGELTQQ
jgi:hypothetical protein